MNQQFKRQISDTLKNDHIYFYWKGRVALFALLKSMGVGAGDEVILPAYTCVVVPNAILYLGAKPIYIDIRPETYNANPAKVNEKITDKTKVIILQNTYGLSSNLEEIISLAKGNNLLTIEDCTHGFGGEYNGRPNGSYCDAAFYSTQWNKPFSTGVGGFSMINNLDLIDKLELINNDLIAPSFKESMSLKAQLIARKYLLNNVTYWAAIKLYRFLSSKGLILGSSSGGEITTTKMPDDYFKSMSKTQSKAGIRQVKNLHKVISQRKKNGHAYTDFLKRNGKSFVSEELHHNHSFLKYPVLVSNRDDFLKLAEKHNITLGDWFTSPLHPVQDNLGDWFFTPSENPVATLISTKVVNLPTEIETKDMNLMLAFLSKNLSHIE